MDEHSFVRAHEDKPPVSIRVNPSKYHPDFSEWIPVSGQVPWCSTGYYLSERPSFTLDPLFHGGAYYVQEASSMFLAHVISRTCDLSKSLRVLDLCAAPGGKSTLIQSLIGEDSFLVSNEVIKGRVGTLCDNITRWGASNVAVTQNDASDFSSLDAYFDLVVVDAPCSGSGLFRKEPDFASEWSLQQVAHCAARQKRILADILPALDEGGILIYSTCSYSPEENEEIGAWLINEWGLVSVRVETDPSWNIVESGMGGYYGYRLYPNLVKGEGFFLSAFQKPGTPSPRIVRQDNRKLSDRNTAPIVNFPLQGDHLYRERNGNVYHYFSPVLFQAMPVLEKFLNVRKAGVRAGEALRGEWIPDHELALSAFLSSEVHRIELDRPQVLDFLRRQNILIPVQQKGWAVISYRGLSLGWVKVLDNRVNNHYPKNWRILNK